MAERWQYVHESPLHIDEICNVTGQDWEDVWDDLIDGLEGAPVNNWEGRTGYMVRWSDSPLLGFLQAQVWDLQKKRMENRTDVPD